MSDQLTRTRSWLVLLLAALVSWGVLQASPAHAEARVVATSPSNGATLTASPPMIMVRMNEPVTNATIFVRSESGSQAKTSMVTTEGDQAYVDISGSLAQGKWTANYRVSTASGTATGTIPFTVGTSGPETDTLSPSAVVPPPSPSATPSTLAPTTTATPSEPSTTSEASESPSTEVSSEPAPATSDEGAVTTPSGSTGTPWWLWPLLAALVGAGLLLGFFALRGRGRDDEYEYDGYGRKATTTSAGYDDDLVRRSAYGQYPEQGQVDGPAAPVSYPVDTSRMEATPPIDADVSWPGQRNTVAPIPPITPTERIPERPVRPRLSQVDPESSDWTSEWLTDGDEPPTRG